MTEPSFAYGVFLSHSAKDKAVVRPPLAERLRTCRAVAARRRRKDGLKVALNFGFRISDFGFAQPGMSANTFGSDWAQLACPAAALVRRRKAGTFRFRDPLHSAFAPRLRRDKQDRRFIPLRLDGVGKLAASRKFQDDLQHGRRLDLQRA